MAQAATLHRFRVELSDIDRAIYESLDLRVARHPSEDLERLVVRVLARVLGHEDGLEFGRGLSNVEEPALWTHGPTGDIRTWIDVGVPSAERLHRASKAAGKVIVFTHKTTAALVKEWSSRSIHRAEDLQVVRLDPALVHALAQDESRSTTWYVTVQDGGLSVAVEDRNVDGSLHQENLAAFLANAAD